MMEPGEQKRQKMDRQEGTALSRSGAATRSELRSELTAALERSLSSEGRTDSELAENGMPLARRESLRASIESLGDPDNQSRLLSLLTGAPLDRPQLSRRRSTPTASVAAPKVSPRIREVDLQALSRGYSLTLERTDVVVDDVANHHHHLAEENESRRDSESSGGCFSLTTTPAPQRDAFAWGRHSVSEGLAPIETFRENKVAAMATSGFHLICCDDEGNAYAAGANDNSQCAKDKEEEYVPFLRRIDAVAVGVKIATVAAGSNFSVFATTAGRVLACGSNDDGQLGLPEGAGAVVTRPTLVRGALSRSQIVDVAAGDQFVLARSTRGDCFCWGAADEVCRTEEDDLLLLNTTTSKSRRPHLVEALVGAYATSLAAGAQHAVVVCALTGEAFAWGRDHHGQCGVGGTGGADDDDVVRTPRRVALTKVVAAAAGRAHSLFLVDKTEVYGVGRNQCGQLDGTPGSAAVAFVDVRAHLPKDAGNIVALAAGDAHSLIADDRGDLYALGSNRAGASNPLAAAAPASSEEEEEDKKATSKLSSSSSSFSASTTTTTTTTTPTIKKHVTKVPLGCAGAGTRSRRRRFVVLQAKGDASVCACAYDEGPLSYAASVLTKTLSRQDSFAALIRRGENFLAITPRDADVVGKSEDGLERLASVVRSPNLLAASFASFRPKTGAPFFDFASLLRCCGHFSDRQREASRQVLVKAVAAGADALMAAGKRPTDAAGRAAAALLCVSGALVVSNEFRTREDFVAVKKSAEALLTTSDDARAAVLGRCLDADASDLRETLRTALKSLVVAAARRSALDGKLPSGDAVNLHDQRRLLRELDRAVDQNARERADLLDRRRRQQQQQQPEATPSSSSPSSGGGGQENEAPEVNASENTNNPDNEAQANPQQPTEEDFQRASQSEQAVRVVLKEPASLLTEAEEAAKEGYCPALKEAFAAALAGAACMDLLRSATAGRVPRSETADAYRVPDVDRLGVVVARKMPTTQQAQGQQLLAFSPTHGALLVDFMKWRDNGGPKGGTQSLATGRWFFSSFSFLLSPSTKRQLCAMDARQRQGEAGARAQLVSRFRGGAEEFGNYLPFSLAGGLAGGSTPLPYLILRVPRRHLVQAALNLLRSIPDSEFSKELKIVFDGEPGVDEGGVRKEFFQLLIPLLFDPVVGMFLDFGGRCLFFNKDCDWYDDEYELAGLLIGLAAYNSVVVDVQLPRLVYKKLLSHLAGPDARQFDDATTLTLDDLAEVDPDLAKGLRQLLDFDGDVENVFMRTFVDDDGRPLLLSPPGGGPSYEDDDDDDDAGATTRKPAEEKRKNDCHQKEVPVTKANRDHYVRALVSKRLVTDVQAQFSKFAEGFCRVMKHNALLHRFVEPEELMLMVQGDPTLDFEALKSLAHYEGYDPSSSPVVAEFWRILEDDFTEDDKRQFLMFVTGSKSAPPGGLAELRPPHHSPFKIQRAGPDSDRLPTSSTCFNTLLLPDYDPPSKLGPLLRLAIQNSEGFGLT